LHFYNLLKSNTRKLTEELNDEERSKMVKRTRQGDITLTTRSFGRGTDFVCYDEKVNRIGGVHVIQTFFSTEPNEEIQIKGRTARQGKNGRYSLLLVLDDIVGDLGLDPKVVQDECIHGHLNCYPYLTEARDKAYADLCLSKKDLVSKIHKDHLNTLDLVENIIKQDNKNVFKQLQEWNNYFTKTYIPTGKATHIVMALDNSGSMRMDNELPWKQLGEAVKFYVNLRIDKGGENDMVTLILYDHGIQDVYSKPIKELEKEVDQYLRSAPPGGGTDFGIAIEKSINVLREIDQSKYDLAFLFLSDGASPSGNQEITKLGNEFGPQGLKTFVFAFGKHSDTNKLQTLANLHGYDAKFLSADISKADTVNSQFRVVAEHISNFYIYANE